MELLIQLMQIIPEEGTVLDMFMGSGSTGVACVRTGRSFVGIELSDEYFETSKRRIEEELEKAGDMQGSKERDEETTG